MIPLLLSLAHAQDASCAAVATVDQLQQVLRDAEAAYQELDEPAFLDHVDTALIRTPCLEAAASPEVAAQLHRIVAVRRYGEAPELAARSVHAAARARPELGVESLVGASHPLARSWDPSPVRTQRLPAPKHGELWFDGTATRRRPVDEPVLAQWVDGDRVRFTQLLAPDAPLPDYEAVPVARAPLRWTAVGAAGGAAASYGLAWTQANRFDDPTLDADQLRAVRGRTNGLLVASGALLTTALGSAIASVVVR